jgi:phospholipase C
VATLPAATVPGADQTPPVQEGQRPRVPWTPQPREYRERREAKAMPGTLSRLQENRTTHASDFERGASDKVYLAKLAAVEGKDVAAGTTVAYVPGIVGGSVAIVNASTACTSSGHRTAACARRSRSCAIRTGCRSRRTGSTPG